MAFASVTLFTKKDKSKHFSYLVYLSAQTKAGQTYKHLQGAGSEIHLNRKSLSFLSLCYYVITYDPEAGITDRC
jgi:hypothetical protein